MKRETAQEIEFSSIAIDCSPAHTKHHLKKSNNNVRNALNDHFEGNCGPFLREDAGLSSAPLPSVAARVAAILRLHVQQADAQTATVPEPQRRQREHEGHEEEAVNDSRGQQEKKDDSNNKNNDTMMMMMNNNNDNRDDDSAVADAVPPPARGRGGARAAKPKPARKVAPKSAAGRGRGGPAAPRGRGGTKNKGEDDDGDDDEVPSSSASSSSSTDGGDDDDASSDDESSASSSSSSEETDQGDSYRRPAARGGRGRGGKAADVVVVAAAATGRGRGRATTAAAAPKPAPKAKTPRGKPAVAPSGKTNRNKTTTTKKKKKDDNEDDDEEASSSSSSSDEDGNDDEAVGENDDEQQQLAVNAAVGNGEADVALLVRKPKALQGKPCKETVDFTALCHIPFRTRREAAAARIAAAHRRDGLPFYHNLQVETNFCMAWHSNVGHPLHILTPKAKPAATMSFGNLLGFIPLSDCACLFPASACSPLDVRRRLLANAFANEQIAFHVPGNFESMDQLRRRFKEVTVNGRRTIELKDTSNNDVVSFKRKCGEIRLLPACYRNSVQYTTDWSANHTILVPPSEPTPTTRDDGKKYIPAHHLSERRFMFNNSPGWAINEFMAIPTEKMHQTFSITHLSHQLHLRLRALLVGAERLNGNQDDFNNAAGLSYRTVATSRHEVWARRFAAFNIAQVYKPKCINENPSFVDLFTAIVPPSVIFERVKEIQKMTAKEIFAKYDNEFTRVDTDIRHIPVRPNGITVDLYPHQRRTVAFMLDRERRGLFDQMLATGSIALPRDPLNPRGYSHFRFFINSAIGGVVAAAVGSPEEAELLARPKHSGGLVADVVGMGKTLSVISAIILNPPSDPRPTVIDAETPIRCGFRPDRAPATPAERTFKQGLDKKLRIKATLILVPVTLVGQWEMEMVKRAPKLSIIRYHGSDRKKYTYDDFAAADIVITTFETYRASLNQEFFWFKWFEAHQNGVGADLLYSKDWAAAGMPAQGPNFFSMQLFAREGKHVKKSVIDKIGGPDQSTVFLSRLHFHRIVMDEFHKPGGLRADMPLVDSNHLWLVSGTPLDADIAPAAKRMGVMDYSFVSGDAVKFCCGNTDDEMPHLLSGSIVQSHFQAVLSYDLYRKLCPIVPFNFGGGLYLPPPNCAATYARFAVLSKLMIRNNIDTCPELANVRVTEKVITLKHSAEEKAKYDDNLTAVQTQIQALRMRGRIQTQIMEVIRLLNELRKAAVDPFGVTIVTQDALAIRGGAQFESENARHNIQLVPIAVFSHLTFPALFPAPVSFSVAELKKNFPQLLKLPTHDDLKNNLLELNKKPPELPTCCVCLDDIQTPLVLACSHVLCRVCCINLIQRGVDQNCPICRRAAVLSATTKKSLLTFPIPEVKEEEVEDDDDENSALNAAAAAAGKNNNKPAIKLPTKIVKVCEIVQAEIRQDPTSKFLIFTAFPSVIACFQQELARLAIGSVTVDASSSLTQRAKRIALFQDRNSYNVRVCIVSSRVGNMGLTLTAANHLIIVEPSSNIDVDTQILGRVKRLGQQRPVTCHRLHIEDTIEVPLYNLVQSRTVSLSAGGSEAAKKQVTDTILQLVYPQGVPDATVIPNFDFEYGIDDGNDDDDDDDDDEY